MYMSYAVIIFCLYYPIFLPLTPTHLLSASCPSISMFFYLFKAPCIYLSQLSDHEWRLIYLTRESYQWLLLRNVTLLPTGTIYCLLTLKEVGDCMSPLPFYDGILMGSVFCRSCIDSHGCCEYMGNSPEDSFCIPSHSQFKVLFASLMHNLLGTLEWVIKMSSLRLNIQHSIILSTFHQIRSFCPNSCPIQDQG